MKPHIFILLAFLVLLGMIVSPVCATELSDAINRGPIYINQTIPITTDICTLVGETPLAPYGWKYCNDHYPGYPDAVCAPPGDQYGVGFPPTTRVVPPGLTNLSKIFLTEMCSDTWWVYEYWEYNATEYVPPVPVASFNCVPTSQFPDASVVCTDTSTNTPTDWYWTLDAENLGIVSWQTSTSQNFTWQSHYPGLYSVNLRANNSAGNDWENKSNYVSISVNATPNNCNLPLASGYSRTLFQCTNAGTDAAISGCDFQLHDLEGSAWSNTTNSGDGRWCIDTLPLHHINGYGQATGYLSGSRLGVQEWNGMIYTISMIPGYLPPPVTGKVWVYVYAHDFDTGQNLMGATVSLSGTGLPTVIGTTGTDGGVGIQWPNVSTAYINVAKSGYTTGVKVITTSSFGPDAVTVDLHKGSQTATITPTPPWSGVTTAPTLDPAGNPGDEGYSNAKGQEMMDFLAQHGMDLVSLCLLVTIIGLLKMAAKK